MPRLGRRPALTERCKDTRDSLVSSELKVKRGILCCIYPQRQLLNFSVSFFLLFADLLWDVQLGKRRPSVLHCVLCLVWDAQQTEADSPFLTEQLKGNNRSIQQYWGEGRKGSALSQIWMEREKGEMGNKD